MKERDALDLLRFYDDDNVQHLANTIYEAHIRRAALTTKLKNQLEDLRLEVKYLIFDLQCTRQELKEAKGG